MAATANPYSCHSPLFPSPLQMKLRFQQKVSDLEGYPDELKVQERQKANTTIIILHVCVSLNQTTQGKLQEAQERLEVYERRNSDQVKLLAELTTKVRTKVGTPSNALQVDSDPNTLQTFR